MIQSVSGMNSGMMAMRGAQGGGGPQKAFSKMDADGDGALNAVEMQNMSDMMAEKMGKDAQSVEDMMAQLDSDGDGALSFSEFEAGRPQGMQQGAAAGMMPPSTGYGKNSMDLSSLFSASDEESESEEEDLYAYA